MIFDIKQMEEIDFFVNKKLNKIINEYAVHSQKVFS